MKGKKIVPLLIIIALSFSGVLVFAAEVDSSGFTGATPPAPEFNPSTEVLDDDGSYETGYAFTDVGIANLGRFAVRFTPIYSPDLLATVRFYIAVTPSQSPLKIHILDASFTELITPLEVSVSTGWNDVDVSSYGLTFTGDYYIALEWTVGYTSYLGLDTSSSYAGRSWVHLTSQSPNWKTNDASAAAVTGNWMIRVGVYQVPNGVIPETPFGTVTAGLMMILGIAVYSFRKASISPSTPFI